MLRPLPPDTKLQDLESEIEKIGQDSVAKLYGFVSWRQLVVHLEPAPDPPDFLQRSCLNYDHTDHPANREQARSTLAENPELAKTSIYHACCVGDVEAVRQFLDEDGSLLDRPGGHFDWPPLLYTCYSRLNLPKFSTLEVARLLLERGANPNAYYMWGGQYRFTALTGAFGDGEGGPKNLPEHEDRETLARLLLQVGADPNDSQALYNRMFCDGNECLELLLEFGLNADHRCNWMVDNEEKRDPNSQQTLQFQLGWAINNHHPERAKLLIENGADLATRSGETPFFEAAMLAGNRDLAEYLVQAGAERVDLDSLAHFACACQSGDREEACSLLQMDPDLMKRLQDVQTGLLHDAAASNRLKAVKLMADLGADLDRQTYNAPLHEACWGGHIEMVRLLVEMGASVSIRDIGHTATPLQWALKSGHHQVVDYLSGCEIDLFDAIICGNLERATALIDRDPARLEQTVDGKTPLRIATIREQPQMVELLLQRGAKPSP